MPTKQKSKQTKSGGPIKGTIAVVNPKGNRSEVASKGNLTNGGYRIKPTHRKIRGYVYDPSFSVTLDHRVSNEVVYKVRWEPDLQPGPIGEYVEVIDYDPVSQSYYTPVDLNDPDILAQDGMPLADNDPRFHQQMVYAVTMSVIDKFERALGRKLIFSHFSEEEGNQFVQRLRIYPHAMPQKNAFYSPEKKALLFGYFKAGGGWNANNIPGYSVFTCLSPDIVSHECTHALLDSMHPYLSRNTNADMLAFHEAFADIIALLQRFSFRSVVQEQIRNSRGDFRSPENMLGSLAFQFGQAMPGARKSLRSYLIADDNQEVKPDPQLYHNSTEPHERGAVLVATIFDAFAKLYKYRVADLLRLASGGTGKLDGEISSDLVNRLSEEACKIADKLLLICIRALDYCPPTDLNFSDYLRALITADVEHNPEDEDGLRFALMEAFRRWGIVPENLNTYSLQSLMWQSMDEYYADDRPQEVENLRRAFRYIFGQEESVQRSDNSQGSKASQCVERILRKNNRREIFEEMDKLGALLHNIFNDKFEFSLDGAEQLLGLNFDTIRYELSYDDGTSETVTAQARNKFQVQRCKPFIRSKANSAETSKQLIVTFLQKVIVDLKGSKYEGYFNKDEYSFRGGATLVIDLASYEIKYTIVKSVTSAVRLQQQLNFAINNAAGESNAALMMQEGEPFAMVHSH